jgi:hypothetical protein
MTALWRASPRARGRPCKLSAYCNGAQFGAGREFCLRPPVRSNIVRVVCRTTSRRPPRKRENPNSKRPPVKAASVWFCLPSLFGAGLAGIALRTLGSRRTGRTRGTDRPSRTGRSRSSGSAVFPGWSRRARRSRRTFKASGQSDRKERQKDQSFNSHHSPPVPRRKLCRSRAGLKSNFTAWRQFNPPPMCKTSRL